MAKSSFNFRYSDSDKSPNNKTQRRTSEIHQRSNVVILDEFIENYKFTESDWFEEDEAPVLRISILGNYKKAKLTDDNKSIFKWVSKYLFNDSWYCHELREMTYDNIVKNDDILQNIFKTRHW